MVSRRRDGPQMGTSNSFMQARELLPDSTFLADITGKFFKVDNAQRPCNDRYLENSMLRYARVEDIHRAKVRQRRTADEGKALPELSLSAKAKAAQAAQAIKQRQKAKSSKDEKAPALASGVHNRTSEAVLLEPEDDEGNVEYKLRLKQPNPVRFQQLVSLSSHTRS